MKIYACLAAYIPCWGVYAQLGCVYTNVGGHAVGQLGQQYVNEKEIPSNTDDTFDFKCLGTEKH
jgi:hypothetical protein